MTVVIGSTGCEGLFDSATLSSLEISSEQETIAGGGEVTLTASGKDEDGKLMSVEPEWHIVSGPGALSSEGSETTYYATDMSYGGEVKIEARVGDITEEKVITVERLLGSEPVQWPEPDSMDYILPHKTATVQTVGEPLDHYQVSQIVYNQIRNITQIKPIVYVKDGALVDPYDSLPNGQSEYLIFIEGGYIAGGEKLPEKPHLSWRVHYELLGSASFEYPDTVEWSRSVTYGTTKTKATEFAEETSAEISAGGSWGWGSVQATVSETIEKKTSESLAIMEENTTKWRFNISSKKKEPKTLGGIYQRVVTFYISDSEGVPVDESSVFEGYFMKAREFTMRQKVNYKLKTWHFE